MTDPDSTPQPQDESRRETAGEGAPAGEPTPPPEDAPTTGEDSPIDLIFGSESARDASDSDAADGSENPDERVPLGAAIEGSGAEPPVDASISDILTGRSDPSTAASSDIHAVENGGDQSGLSGFGPDSSERRLFSRKTALASAAPTGSKGPLVAFLFTWASVATLVAGLLWTMRPEQRSPLEDLPDNGVLKDGIVSPLERLSSRELFDLGETKRIGALEITPLEIAYRPVTMLPDRNRTDPVFVLKLRIRNASRDEVFCPTDPAFFYPDPSKKLAGLEVFDRNGYTYTFIQPAAQPNDLVLPHDVPYEQGISVDGQRFETLEPGQVIETIVISREGAKDRLTGKAVWRVMLRKRMRKPGKGIATVIGVRFGTDDVRSDLPES